MRKDIRIKRPKDKEKLTEKLLYSKKKNKYGVFDSYYEVMMFAASIGIKYKGDRSKNGYVEFTSFSEPVNLSYFNQDFIDLIAIKHKYDPRYLDWEDETIVNEKIKIFESYVNGGLEIIQEVVDNSTNVLEDITQLLLKELSKDSEINVDAILSDYND